MDDEKSIADVTTTLQWLIDHRASFAGARLELVDTTSAKTTISATNDYERARETLEGLGIDSELVGVFGNEGSLLMTTQSPSALIVAIVQCRAAVGLPRTAAAQEDRRERANSVLSIREIAVDANDYDYWDGGDDRNEGSSSNDAGDDDFTSITTTTATNTVAIGPGDNHAHARRSKRNTPSKQRRDTNYENNSTKIPSITVDTNADKSIMSSEAYCYILFSKREQVYYVLRPWHKELRRHLHPESTVDWIEMRDVIDLSGRRYLYHQSQSTPIFWREYIVM